MRFVLCVNVVGNPKCVFVLLNKGNIKNLEKSYTNTWAVLVLNCMNKSLNRILTLQEGILSAAKVKADVSGKLNSTPAVISKACNPPPPSLSFPSFFLLPDISIIKKQQLKYSMVLLLHYIRSDLILLAFQ